MRKVICVFPCTPKSAIRRLSSSLEQGLPSMHRATTAPPLGRRSRMAAPSACRAFCISAGEGSSGRRYSGSSTMSSLQDRCSRLTYSAAASVIEFFFQLAYAQNGHSLHTHTSAAYGPLSSDRGRHGHGGVQPRQRAAPVSAVPAPGYCFPGSDGPARTAASHLLPAAAANAPAAALDRWPRAPRIRCFR